MKEIDGSDGGGQILRSALALAAVTETPVCVTGIRGNRPEPGLKPQHLTAVETLATITGADLAGAEPGATTLEFDPGASSAMDVTASIGTAGSIPLLFDAILPLATKIEGPLSITATGGTEVKWSPPLVAHERIKLPLCREFGFHSTLERHRTGFYPAGGGCATLSLQPSTLSPLEADERGAFVTARCYSIASRDLQENEVAKRQAATARQQLEEGDLSVSAEHHHIAETKSTGSAVLIELEYEHTRAGFDALGEPGVPAETIATRAVEKARTFTESEAAVDEHLADQLLIFLALGGGAVKIPTLTAHVETSLDLLETFGFDLTVDTSGSEPVVQASVPDER